MLLFSSSFGKQALQFMIYLISDGKRRLKPTATIINIASLNLGYSTWKMKIVIFIESHVNYNSGKQQYLF